MLVRRGFYRELGGFDERYPHAHMEDLDFQTRARATAPAETFSRNAVVDHPPRRLAGGRTLGATHYGEVIFSRIHGTPLSFRAMVRRIAGTRWRAIRRHPRSGDTLRALASLVLEVVHVARHWREWRQRAEAITESR